jgi:aspartate racemase
MFLGIIGGMGPDATNRFLQKMLYLTPILKDQDHIPYLLISTPEIPDRSLTLLSNNKKNMFEIENTLVKNAKLLERNDVTHIVMICNTAHYWVSKIRNRIQIPFISIIEETCEYIQSQNCNNICILATSATKKEELYASKFNKLQIQYGYPNEQQQENLMRAIYFIKGKRIKEAKELLTIILTKLKQFKFQYFLLGCTELPLVLKGNKFLDPSVIVIQKILTLFE